MNSPETSNRILVIDDNPAIHEDFRKILLEGREGEDTSLEDLLSAVLDKPKANSRHSRINFLIDSAYQGQEGLAMVEAAVAADRPYALAFVDIRMPPGWDGVETITHLWAKDPSLQVVICTAYSDYSWQEIVSKLGNSDRLVILKKPFDNIEVLQLAHAMTKKWRVTRQASARLDDLDRLVSLRTAELEVLNGKLALEIADREEAQAALRLSEERLARAFDACPLPTAIVQVFDQRIIQVNPAFLATTELVPADAVGESLWNVGLEATEDFQRTAATRLFRGEPLRRHECNFVTKSGERRQGLLWLEPFALAAGPHVLAVLQDVTEQSVLEMQMRQAQKMEAVGHLAAGVAHDFNNLLTVIHGHTSVRLLNTNLDRKVADSLRSVQQAAERAADLTRQLLAFSRKQVMEKGTLSLANVINNVAAMLRRLIPASVRLHFLHTSDQPFIFGDRCNLEQVLLNLVVNARDAMPRGGDIHVSTAIVEIDAAHLRRVPEARAGQFVCLEVRDTGDGMDDATLSQIFEPFFTTKSVGNGTGMGLSTVHGIVKQHDGWIEVVSARDQGSTFRVFFPLVAPAAEVAVREDRPLIGLSDRLTVLLAEDDHGVRSLARHILEEINLRVIEATDAISALELWEEHRDEIDLLLTDMVMPGNLTGADLADRILKEKPSLPVIFSSGYSVALFNGDRNFRKDINYLPKPYVASDLITIVTSVLAKPDPAISLHEVSH